MYRGVSLVLRCASFVQIFLCIGQFVAFANLCSSCKQSYSDFTRLAVHCALKHELWLCPNCQKTFLVEDKKAYWQHRSGKHEEFVCFVCNLRAFRNKTEWKRHCKRHEEKVLSLLNDFPCCPEMPDHAETVWVQELHAAHRHGSWIAFLCKVRPLHKYCEPFRNDVFEAALFKCSREAFLQSMRDFSKHVCEVHEVCFFCERNIENDMFDRQAIRADFFLQPRKNMFLSNTENSVCFCGKNVQRNAESQLFALKIDRLPFGTDLDTVTHPFYCIVDRRKNAEKDLPEGLKAENTVSSKSDDKSSREHSDKSINNHSKAAPSPSLSTKSVDTTLTSIDDKKYIKLPTFDDGVVPSTDNEINVK